LEIDMPRVYDNIGLKLLPALERSLKQAYRADICVGYISLAGWNRVGRIVATWPGGDGHCCRLIIGMQESLGNVDASAIEPLKQKIAENFAAQLTMGGLDERNKEELYKLSYLLEQGKVVIKLFLKHKLHAKLYLVYREDADNPVIGYLGSSNMTMAGLNQQGELNVNILDTDTCDKLTSWFNERWSDPACHNISTEVADMLRQVASGKRVPTRRRLAEDMLYVEQGQLAGMNTAGSKATEKQVDAIYGIASDRLKLKPSEINQYVMATFKTDIAEMSKTDASQLIDTLMQRPVEVLTYATKIRQTDLAAVKQEDKKPGCGLFATLLVVVVALVLRLI